MKLVYKEFFLSFVEVFLLLSVLNSCNKNPNDILLPFFEAPAYSRPRIIDSNPSESTGHYDPTSPPYIIFDREMDKFSTERAFSLSGASSGELRWVGNLLALDLIKPLDPGVSYVLRVAGSAKATNNALLEKEFMVHFISGSTVEAPILLSNTPVANSQAVPPNSEVILVFSRPMNRISVEQAFNINPSTYGAFIWSGNDTIVTFQPYSDLQEPIRYSVNLGVSATDKEGISLHEPLSFSFQTGDDVTRPTIVEIREQGALMALTHEYDGVQKEASFNITFSEPMKTLDTENAISLRRQQDGASVSINKLWSPTFDQLTIKPNSDLNPETNYRINVSNSAKDLASNALLESFNIDFKVSNVAGALNSDYLRLINAEKSAPGATQSIDLSTDVTTIVVILGSDQATSGAFGADGQFVFNFSHSLDPASLPESLSISKVLGSHPASGRILGINLLNNGPLVNGRILLMIGGLGAGNEYRLKLSGGKSSNNRSLLSESQVGENPTYLAESVILNLRVESQP